MKLFKSKSEKESVKNLIRDFFNFQECILNHGTDKIESDIESLKIRVHRLECSASSANNVDTFAGKTKNELNDCIKDYDLKISRMLAIAFENGAEWQSKQSPWISVEERLPEYPCWVLVTCKEYKYRILFYCEGKFYTDKSLTSYDGSVLFWIPIPSLDKDL